MKILAIQSNCTINNTKFLMHYNNNNSLLHSSAGYISIWIWVTIGSGIVGIACLSGLLGYLRHRRQRSQSGRGQSKLQPAESVASSIAAACETPAQVPPPVSPAPSTAPPVPSSASKPKSPPAPPNNSAIISNDFAVNLYTENARNFNYELDDNDDDDWFLHSLEAAVFAKDSATTANAFANVNAAVVLDQ
ncbi:hypothetical protein BOX15_Mlig019379g1 [Macrostomum lignano]|uniref:Uncharacterized protein n=1 Tax=Macrostomum lignano TaxID=282301 RepID=A0A267EMR0_9PLAT|nr:hypothetical protein BOX15_Mlig019379g1 [Macrostomum lignano]